MQDRRPRHLRLTSSRPLQGMAKKKDLAITWRLSGNCPPQSKEHDDVSPSICASFLECDSGSGAAPSVLSRPGRDNVGKTIGFFKALGDQRSSPCAAPFGEGLGAVSRLLLELSPRVSCYMVKRSRPGENVGYADTRRNCANTSGHARKRWTAMRRRVLLKLHLKFRDHGINLQETSSVYAGAMNSEIKER